MGDRLSDDRIAALVAAARDGRLDDETGGGRRQPAVRRMSFTRPTKFTHDLQRRLRRTHETFCRKASSRLATELRLPVDMEIISLNQHTWANAHAELPPTSLFALLETKGMGTRMMFCAEHGLIVAVIEVMLGGSLDAPPRERRLSDIDMALARMFFGDLVEDLSAVWQDSAGLGIELGSLESHADAGELSLVSEPTLAITCEVRLGGLSTTLTLVVPYRSIEPVADRLAATGAREGQGGDEARRQMSGALSAVELAVRAEVASVDLPIARIATLRPGDLIEFNRLASDGVTLYAGSALLGRGAPGQSSGRRAVQFLGPEGGPR